MHVEYDEFIASWPQSFQEALHLFEQEKLFQAHRRLSSFEESLNSLILNSQDSPEKLAKLQEIQREKDANPAVSRIHFQFKQIESLLKSVQSDEGWSVQHAGSDCRILYRHEDYTQLHSFKIEVELDVPLLTLMVLVYEINLYNTVFPFLKFCNEIAHPHRCTKLAHWCAKAPWPLSNRDCIVLGFAADGLDEDGGVIVCSRSVSSFEGTEIPPPQSRTVRMEMHLGGFLFRPINEARTHVIAVSNMDPKFTFIPASLMNFITGHVIRLGVHFVKRRANNLKGSQHEARLSQDKEFYQWLDNRAKEYLESKGLEYHGLESLMKNSGNQVGSPTSSPQLSPRMEFPVTPK
mmetsp:Transcript_43060/g.69885  ORF Transcript_43060/g.69885 Transcript_43060/m.69885 type:complete len:349 (-) Transcript_43060:595-1641(-)